MEDSKRPQGGSQPPEERKGFDRRSAIKRALMGAAVVGAAFAPTVKALAVSGIPMSSGDTEVSAASVVQALQQLVNGTLNVSGATKLEISGKFDTVLTALKDQAMNPITAMSDARASVSTHATELDGANNDGVGGPGVRVQDDFGTSKGVGTLVLNACDYFLTFTVVTIRAFRVTLFGVTFRWILACITTFAVAVSITITVFTVWRVFWVALWVWIIIPNPFPPFIPPFIIIGRALLIIFLIVCARLTTVTVTVTQIVTFRSCILLCS